MTDTTDTRTTDTRSVETAWAETLAAELPLPEDERPRAYANFLFGNPLFTTGEIGPDAAVVLIDDLLDRHPPTEFFGVEGALSPEEWATLKETLVGHLAEGVDGERPGPASAFPGTDAGPAETGAAQGTASPDTAPGPSTGTAPTGRGFASEGLDLDGSITTPTDLARAVDDLVTASGLDPGEARRALEVVLADLDDDAGGDAGGDDGA